MKFVTPWRDKKTGRVYFRFRKRGHKPVMLPGPYGSDQFKAAYYAALGGKLEPGLTLRSKAGCFSAAVAAYYMSHEFRSDLSPGTQYMRRTILERWRAQFGDLPLKRFQKEHLVAYLQTLKPHAARSHAKALRGLLQHAGHDVTAGMKLPKVTSRRHHSWTDAEIAQFEAHFPLGSKQRLCFALLKYTGQRCSDIARMGRQHIQDGVITVLRQQKTGNEIYVPIHPQLQAVIDATPGDDLTFVITKNGGPYRANDLSAAFGQWCDQAALPDRCVMHGMRHATGTLLAEIGCSVKLIAAILACSEKNALHYCEAADDKKLARSAMQMWVASTNEQPTRRETKR